MSRSSRREADGGQATVEAAVLVPVVFLLLVLLCQPIIVLYDRMVMSAAAGQAVRMLSTRASGAPDVGYEQVVKDQLAAIPGSDVFHVGGDRWDIELEGSETSGEVRVVIENKVRPLPLMGLLAGAAGLSDGEGNLGFSVEATGRTQPRLGTRAGHRPCRMDRSMGLRRRCTMSRREEGVRRFLQEAGTEGVARNSSRDPFLDEDGGFTTLSVAVSLLLVCALLFSAAQVYWVNTESPDIQFAADAGALAAENSVAQYYVLARAADATVLSMSLMSLTMFGVATVLCCIPPTVPIGMELMGLARKVADARDKLASSARKVLDGLQRALPIIAAANASTVIARNGGESDSASFVGTAVLLPITGDAVSIDSGSELDEAADEIEEGNAEVAKHSSEMGEALEEMDAAKLRAYMADCGNSPGYCMYQRAKTLAGMSGVSNPFYSSVENWSFTVALNRARAYYNRRLAIEAPESASLEEQVRSACRRQYYGYAVELLGQGYVNEGESFSAYFPLLPKNTSEMRGTRLYTDAVWPISADGVMHGCASCPAAAGIAGYGSVAQLDSGACKHCETCGFAASTLGKVGAPSASIDNGFEYHYRIVAEAAREYEGEARKAAREERAAKGEAGKAFETFGEAMEKLSAKGKRYNPKPPGRHGCICVVADLSSHEVPAAFASSFVGSRGRIGPRVAVSAAALGKDTPREGENIISSMMDALYEDTTANGSASPIAGGMHWLVDIWGGALDFYVSGVDAVSNGIEKTLNSIPVLGSLGLGTWAKDKLLGVIDGLGISPPDLSTPKPVVVNTSHVLERTGSSLAQVLALARGYLGTGEMPDELTIEGPFDTPITIQIPRNRPEVPGAILSTLQSAMRG
ncbi:MAG: TadE/TadG family type IV pilus assembly protein [Coriobacteriales bacterium]|jgi:hypothetical protein